MRLVVQLVFSRNAELMVFISNNTVMLYRRNGDSFVITSDSFAAAGTPTAAAVSPDGRFVIVTSGSNIYGWRVTAYNKSANTTLTAFTTNPISDTPSAAPINVVAFSPNSQYLALGGTSSRNIILYHIDRTGTFTEIANPTGWTDSASNIPTQISFSADSNYLAFTTSNTSLPVAMFRRTSATTFEYQSLPAPLETTVSGATAVGLAFSN